MISNQSLKRDTVTLLSILIATLTTSFTLNTPYINPTGTYSLVSKSKVTHSDIYGRTGSLQVKLLSKNKVVIVVEVNMGYRAYNSGLFIDTMIYKGNRCSNNKMSDDSTCKITFTFTNRGVRVTQQQGDLNDGCGFGHGVFADGYYRKESSKVSKLINPETGEAIR